VQYRDKTSDTAHLIRTAKEIHDITQKYNIPLLVNDRVDVALAIGAEGVHMGQDDLDLATTRKLLGERAIIGVTACSSEEALKAAAGGANYLGLGTVFATPTKENAKFIVGCSGVRTMLNSLVSAGHKDISTVCIGGVNASNIQRVLYQSRGLDKGLDGIAVVSAIMGTENPKDAAKELRRLIAEPPSFARVVQPSEEITMQKIQTDVPMIVKKLANTTPLCHNMTNLVVQNIAANVALCIGASPIMSNNGLEASDLSKLGGSLVINMGTVTPEGLQNYLIALKAYNVAGGPVVLDPVGAGATQQRRDAVTKLLAGGFFDVIKGNENEIKTIAGTSGGEQQRGVDSGTSTLSLVQKTKLVKDLAKQERNVVLLTGKQDIVSDGSRTLIVENGHEYLGVITGSGCCLGTTIASFLAVHQEDRLMATLAGMLMFEVAAEIAAANDSVHGPGTFVPAFLDSLYAIHKNSTSTWCESARVRQI
jgi:thiamine-phosphate diphosphorylase/hydroxyethylthiazole kinase